jgi:hypothetical protein
MTNVPLTDMDDVELLSEFYKWNEAVDLCPRWGASFMVAIKARNECARLLMHRFGIEVDPPEISQENPEAEKLTHGGKALSTLMTCGDCQHMSDGPGDADQEEKVCNRYPPLPLVVSRQISNPARLAEVVTVPSVGYTRVMVKTGDRQCGEFLPHERIVQ